MRVAIHVNNEEYYEIPLQLSHSKIEQLKQSANKGSYECPLCRAKLRVDSGPVKGTYFIHHKGEACEDYELADQTYFAYKEQIKREEPRQQVVVALLHNELEGLAKIYPELQVKKGINEPLFQKYVPDVAVKLGNRKFAMSVITRINRDTDKELSINLKKRRHYFENLGYEPIWFVERKHVALELGQQEIVFWASEKELLQESVEDRKWSQFFNTMTTPSLLTELLELKKPLASLDVQSIMYLSPKDDGKFLLYRFIEEEGTHLSRAYYLKEPYEMTMAEALRIQEGNFVFAISEQDEQNRQAFKDRYEAALENVKRKVKEEEERKAKERATHHSEKIKQQDSQNRYYTEPSVNNQVSKEAKSYKTYLNQFSFEKELQEMNRKEQFIFNNLIDKYNLTHENFPGICKVEILWGKKIHTSFSVWQLWAVDQVLTTFQTTPLTVYNLFQRFRAIFRFDKTANEEVREVLHEYLRILEDAGFLKHRHLDKAHIPFPIKLNSLPLVDNFKLNSYVAFRNSRYFNADDPHALDVGKAQDEYKLFIKSFSALP